MDYPISKKYEMNFLRENIMGPNPIKLLEELFLIHSIPRNKTVLDLGCGRGITSAFMVKEYGLRVFATDLWISATENKERFDSMDLTSDKIIPIHAEAHELPFAEDFFDAVVSVDAYHYFGLDENYLSENLLPVVKSGGYLIFAVPGLKKDIHDNIPEEMLLSWSPEDISSLHDKEYWENLIIKTKGIEIISISEMESFDECWDDWLSCENEYAKKDRKAMDAGAGKYMNFISIVIKKL